MNSLERLTGLRLVVAATSVSLGMAISIFETRIMNLLSGKAEPVTEMKEVPLNSLPKFELRENQKGDPLFEDATRFYTQLSDDKRVLYIDKNKFKDAYLSAGISVEARATVINQFLRQCIGQLQAQGIDPGLYLDGLPEEKLLEEIVGLLNSFLVKQNGQFLDFDETNAVLNIWDVEKLETLVVKRPEGNYVMPVAHLGNSIFTNSQIPLSSDKESARFQPFPGLVVSFAENDPKEKEASIYHEGVHAAIMQKFKEIQRAALTNSSVPVNYSVQFGQGIMWNLNGEFHPILFDEMCAEGASQSTIPDNNRKRLFALFTVGQRRQYQYCTIYALHSLLATPGFSEEYKEKIRRGLSGGDFSMKYEDLEAMVNHPSLTSQRIQEIYRGMWETGYDILSIVDRNLSTEPH